MKRLQVPKLRRLHPNWVQKKMVRNTSGDYVMWEEVRMLLSILVGHGIIEIQDTEFPIGVVEIDGGALELDMNTDDRGYNGGSPNNR